MVRILLILISVQGYVADVVSIADPAITRDAAAVQRNLKKGGNLHQALDDVPGKHKHKDKVRSQLKKEMGDEFEDELNRLDGVP